MKYIPVYCPICNTDFDLVEDEYGYMGVCNCEEIPEDLGLEDTVFYLKHGQYIDDCLLEKRRSESK